MVTALVAVVLGAHCVTPADQTAGWKQTPIPSSAPALAAPGDVEQFRSGERALVVDETARVEYRADPKAGRLGLSFDVPPATQHLRVQFQHRLDGMKVDAWTQDATGRTMPVLDGRRVAGDEVRLDWPSDEVRVVGLTLHHHLRERPIVSEWRAGRWQVVSELPGVPALFRQPGMLSWRHPGGRKVELCDEPEQRLEVRGVVSAGSVEIRSLRSTTDQRGAARDALDRAGPRSGAADRRTGPDDPVVTRRAP